MDTRILFQLPAVILGCIFAYLVLIHISTPALTGLRAVCYAYAFACVGVELVAQRGQLPDLFTIILGGQLLLTTNIFLYRGLNELLRAQASYKWLFAVSFIPSLVIGLYYTYVHPEIMPRVVVYSLVICAQNVMLALLTLSNGSDYTRFPRRCMSALFLCWAIINAARAGVAIVVPHPSLFPVGSSIGGITTVLPVLAAVLTGYAFLWLSMTKLQHELELQSRTDVLTGLLNRRALDLTVTREIARARRSNVPLSIILLDLDSFKSINDRYGHDAGDHALSMAAHRLTECLRSIDLIARIGGEEFVMFLPDATLPIALEVAERLRHCVRDLVVHYQGKQIRLSGSFGVTELTPGDLTWEDMMRRADLALYRAKAEGKDRVIAL